MISQTKDNSPKTVLFVRFKTQKTQKEPQKTAFKFSKFSITKGFYFSSKR